MQLGLGTAAIGRPQYINIRSNTPDMPFDLETFRKRGVELLDQAYNSGVRYFDTAPGYGIAEDLLIKWLENHQDINISVGTKWGYTYVADFNPAATVHEIKEHSVSKLKEQWSVSQSLIPHLKYYQIHSATIQSGVLDNDNVLNELSRLKKHNKIKIGLTTSGVSQSSVLRHAIEVNRKWDNLFDVFQVTYNMLDQGIADINEFNTSNNYTIIIKEALANGRIFRSERYPNYFELYATLEKLADSYQVGVDAIALRFSMQSFPNSIVLSGASTMDQLGQNLLAEQIILSQNDMEDIKKHVVPSSMYWDERKELIWN